MEHDPAGNRSSWILSELLSISLSFGVCKCRPEMPTLELTTIARDVSHITLLNRERLEQQHQHQYQHQQQKEQTEQLQRQ